MAYRPPKSATQLLPWFESDCHDGRCYRLKNGKEICSKCGKECEAIQKGTGPAAYMKKKPRWGMNKIEPKQ